MSLNKINFSKDHKLIKDIIIESGKIDWFKTKKFPSLTMPTESYHGLIFAETFGDFGYSMKLRADSLRDLGTHL